MLTDGISFITGSAATNFAVASGSTFPTDTNSVGELFYLTSGESGLYVFNGTDWQPTTTGAVSFDALNVKAAVRVATTTNITLLGTQTIDGVTVAPGDRVLVKNQSATNANGIYIVSSGGWARAEDFDNSPDVEVRAGDFVFVTEGQTQADTGWVLTTNGTITIGGSALTFAQFTGGGVTSVAASGGTTGLTFSGSPITSSGTLTLDGTLALTNGGTGATTQPGAANAILPPQAGASGQYLTTDGTNVSWAVVSGGGGSFNGGTVTTPIAISSSTQPQLTVGTATVTGQIVSAQGSTTGTGGLQIFAGGTTTGGSAPFEIRGGSGVTGGGNITITGGSTVTGNFAGTVTVAGGNRTGGGGSRGGDVNLAGGGGGIGTAGGGIIDLRAGDGGSGSGSAGGDIRLTAGTGNAGQAGNITLTPGISSTGGGYFVINTAATTSVTERFRILNNGAWSVGTSGTATGSSGQVLTSNGNASAPTWQNITLPNSNIVGTVSNSPVNISGISGTNQTSPFTISAGAVTAGNVGNQLILTGGSTAQTGAGSKGGTVLVRGGEALALAGGDAIIRGGNTQSTGSSTLQIGGSVTVAGGSAVTNGAGGSVIIAGGDGVGLAQNYPGGNVSITGGTAANGGGGSINITSGLGSTSATSGSVTIAAANTQSGTSSGTVTLRSGDGPVSSGQITVRGGDVTGASASAGQLTLRGGNASGSTGAAGSVTIAGGNSSNATSGTAGTVTIRGGNGNSTPGAALTLSGGTSTSSTGGDVIIQTAATNTQIERVRVKNIGSVRFVPMAQPATAEAGDTYYDSSTNKLRCYNGTVWNDLF